MGRSAGGLAPSRSPQVRTRARRAAGHGLPTARVPAEEESVLKAALAAGVGQSRLPPVAGWLEAQALVPAVPKLMEAQALVPAVPWMEAQALVPAVPPAAARALLRQVARRARQQPVADGVRARAAAERLHSEGVSRCLRVGTSAPPRAQQHAWTRQPPPPFPGPSADAMSGRLDREPP